MMATSSQASSRPCIRFGAVAAALAVLALPALVRAQTPPVTPSQRATATQVAQAGVPLSELAPNAPDQYTIKRGDTLWAISGLFLKSPWRWPELWGMNMQEVRNPHRIYPGQTLVLEKKDGRAMLRMQGGQSNDGVPPTEVVKVTPRTRIENLADGAIPTIKTHLLEPFLAEPLVVSEEETLTKAPRIVATQEGRVLVTRGDRAYARASDGNAMADRPGPALTYRVFRNAQPLKDPVTQAVLGYEAQYLGKAQLVRGEAREDVLRSDGKTESRAVPATIDIISAKEEMRVGDRLVPEPGRELVSYAPHAPERKVEGRVVSMYGEAVGNAGQNQVVVINKGKADGMEQGHVLAILKDGTQMTDRTQTGERTEIKLPDERNGLLMVFKAFDRLSYALILEITDGVRIGDRVVNPR